MTAAKQVLAPDGEIPPTVLVLDEVQQYINEAQDRSATITELAEALQTRFDSRVLLVASGQSALSAGTKALQWLSDRFRTSVQLTDAEVEAVTREVLLLKRPTATPAIERMFEGHAGEVSRHLSGTRLAVRPEDGDNHVGDYPLLRTRRRFWEACFQTADPSGTQSQLRSQLRILYDSLQEIAEEPLGTAIPASDLFRALAADLVGSDVLLNEINTRIAKLDDGTPEGTLRADLCGLVFLIGKLPRQDAVDLGVRANASTLADLLVKEITSDSGPFRHTVGVELEKLADEGVLMKVADEYRIQTTEGADWERAFREERTALARNEVEVAARREQLLRGAVQEIVGQVRPVHGEAKIRRRVELRLHGDPDPSGSNAIGVQLGDDVVDLVGAGAGRGAEARHGGPGASHAPSEAERRGAAKARPGRGGGPARHGPPRHARVQRGAGGAHEHEEQARWCQGGAQRDRPDDRAIGQGPAERRCRNLRRRPRVEAANRC